MIITIGWVTTGIGILMAAAFILFGYKRKIFDDIKELKLITTSGFAAPHMASKQAGNIYREGQIQENVVLKRGRTVSASARSLLREVEEERRLEREQTGFVDESIRNIGSQVKGVNSGKELKEEQLPKKFADRFLGSRSGQSNATPQSEGQNALQENISNDRSDRVNHSPKENQGKNEWNIPVEEKTGILDQDSLETLKQENPQESFPERRSTKHESTDILNVIQSLEKECEAKARPDETDENTDMLFEYSVNPTEDTEAEEATGILDEATGILIDEAEEQSDETDILNVAGEGTAILEESEESTQNSVEAHNDSYHTDILRDAGTEILTGTDILTEPSKQVKAKAQQTPAEFDFDEYLDTFFERAPEKAEGISKGTDILTENNEEIHGTEILMPEGVYSQRDSITARLEDNGSEDVCHVNEDKKGMSASTDILQGTDILRGQNSSKIGRSNNSEKLRGIQRTDSAIQRRAPATEILPPMESWKPQSKASAAYTQHGAATDILIPDEPVKAKEAIPSAQAASSVEDQIDDMLQATDFLEATGILIDSTNEKPTSENREASTGILISPEEESEMPEGTDILREGDEYDDDTGHTDILTNGEEGTEILGTEILI